MIPGSYASSVRCSCQGNRANLELILSRGSSQVLPVAAFTIEGQQSQWQNPEASGGSLGPIPQILP